MHCHLRAMTNLTIETQNTSDAFVTWNRPLFLSGRVLSLVLTNNFIVFCFQLGNSNSDIDTPTPPSSFHRRGSSRGSMRKVLPPGRNFNINLDSVICIEKIYILLSSGRHSGNCPTFKDSFNFGTRDRKGLNRSCTFFFVYNDWSNC